MKKLFFLLLLTSSFAPAQSTVASILTPAAESARLIQGLRDAYHKWEKREPGFEDEGDFVNTLNGKPLSRKQRESGHKEFHAVSVALDAIEVTFSGVFPSKAIMSYRQYTPVQQGNGKVKVLNVYVSQTFVYVDSDWKLMRMDSVSVR